MAERPPTDDTQDLARQGYRQELDRTLGSFSAFAAGFSYLSILTGIFQNFHLGYKEGGPAFFWTWPLMFFGQLAVALCFAELAAHYPLCGGVYQWSRHVGTHFVGWMAGWVYLASLIVTLAAVALALQVTLPQIWPAAKLSPDNGRNAVILGTILIVFSTIVNAVGVRWLARINNAGVFAEMFGALLLIVLLAVHVRRGPGVLFDTQGRGAGEAGGYFGAFCAAAVMASYVMYGYDTAGTLAEETAEPRRRAPRAILQALTAAAVGGGLLLLFALLSAGSLTDPGLSSDEHGLPDLVKDVLGKELGTVFLVDVVFAISVCVLAVHTGAARLLFAMARDGSLPFAGRLARVSPHTKTPTLPVLVAGGSAVALLLVNVNFTQVVEAMVAVSIVWANLAYLLVTVPLLVSRWQRPRPDLPGLFTLGKCGIAVNIVAVVWGSLTAVNMAWPRVSVYGGDAWYHQYAAPLYTGVLLLVGVVYYALWGRHHERCDGGVPSRADDRRVVGRD
jgi:urea carboxylase system permease